MSFYGQPPFWNGPPDRKFVIKTSNKTVQILIEWLVAREFQKHDFFTLFQIYVKSFLNGFHCQLKADKITTLT